MLKRKKEFKRFLRYILPTMIILLTFIFVSQVTLHLTKQEAKETSTKISRYFVQNLEESLENLQIFTYDLLMSKQAEKIQNMDAEMAADQQLLDMMNALSNELYNSCMVYDLLADTVIYYPELDLTASRKNCLSSFQYLHLDYHDLTEDSQEYQRLYQMFFEHTNNEVVAYSSLENSKAELFFVRTLPQRKSGTDRILVVRLDVEKVSAMMEELLQSTDFQYIAMVNETGSICASAGTMGNEKFTTIEEVEEALEDHMYTRFRSSIWNMDFCFVQRNGEAYYFANTIFTISLTAMLVGAVLGLLLAIGTYYDNFRKEKELLRNLPFDIQESEDVFSAVNTRLNAIYEENAELIEQMERQNCMIGNAFLKELLHMQGVSRIEIEYLCAIYGVSLENECFSLFFSIPRTGAVPGKKDHILSMIHDISRDDFSVYWTTIEQVDIFLCNYEPTSGNSAMLEFRKLLQEKLPQRRIYQLPQILFSVTGIPEYFRNQYAEIIRGGRPIAEKNIVDEQQLSIRQFLEAVQQRQLEEACSLLPVLSETVSKLSQTKQGFCQMYALLGELYRLPAMQPYLAELDYVFEDTTGKSWITRLDYILRQAAKDVDAYSVQQSTVEQAYTIIMKEYHNALLSLSLLAERLNVSQSYLSRAFKQRYQENVLHFLNRVRVEHAKEYLQQTNDSIHTIALRVGFLSDMNLIRVFKKLEAETPGNFRKRQTTS